MFEKVSVADKGINVLSKLKLNFPLYLPIPPLLIYPLFFKKSIYVWFSQIEVFFLPDKFWLIGRLRRFLEQWCYVCVCVSVYYILAEDEITDFDWLS